MLQSELKRKSRWIPPLSEIWGLIFGGAGDSKGPLLLFMGSVLLWGYPMYMIRVSIFIFIKTTKKIGNIIFLVHTHNMEYFASFSLLFYLLEYCHVVKLGHSQ